MKRTKKFKWGSESDMCEAFIAQYKAAGWAAHAEQFGFDFVLVSPVGERIGVEAKLQTTVGVLHQAISREDGFVHFRAVLVPHPTDDFVRVARRLKIHVFRMPSTAHELFWRERAGLQPLEVDRPPAAAMRWCHEVRGELLRVAVRGLRPGAPAPRAVTRWKVQAVQFCLSQGKRTFTRKEFDSSAKVDMSRWVKYGWINQVGDEVRNGRSVHIYQLTDHHERPDLQYPELADAIRATA